MIRCFFEVSENKEIIENSILHWINDSYESSKLRQMLNALIRCDIIDKSKTAFIMELKTIKKKETKEESLEEAIKRINERKYETEILKRGITDIMKLAIVFDGKDVWIKKG
jgi:hypothetical protein